MCSGAVPDGSGWLHVEPWERTTGGGDDYAERSWPETKLLSGVFMRPLCHQLMSASCCLTTHAWVWDGSFECTVIPSSYVDWTVSLFGDSSLKWYDTIFYCWLVRFRAACCRHVHSPSSLVLDCRFWRWRLQGALCCDNSVEEHVISPKFRISISATVRASDIMHRVLI